MAENIENNGCSQRENAEHEGYVKASRSFNRIWKERDSAQSRLLEAILYKDNFSTKTDRETIGTDTETAEKILKLMKEEPAITAKMIAKQLELSVSGVRYHINKLKKDGVVEHIGSSKKGTWLIHK